MKKTILLIFAAATLVFGCCSKKETSTSEIQEEQVQPVFEGRFSINTQNSDQSQNQNEQTSQTSETQAAEETDDFVKEAKLCELAQKYGFKVGACISYNQVNRSSYIKMLTGDFNTTTATNEFKAYSLLNQAKSIQNGVPVMNYAQADAIAKLAQENGIGIRGHVLVWDAYMSDWFFREGYKSDGQLVSKEVLEERLAYYIDQVITHFETQFPGVVYCWDVVNEAVADGDNEWIPGNEFHIRQTRGGSINRFNEILGPDYVKYAFKCARQTVNKVNPNIKLFYNDYNTFYQDKRDAIIRLIKDINKEEKLCDGLGMQGYIGGYGQQAGCMNNNDISLVKTAIKMYSSLGLEVQLTEVAVRNYDQTQINNHAKFYGNLFRAVISAINEGANFTGFTIWGITDNPSMPKTDYSYKMNGPYCGLFDQYYQIKQAYKEVYRALEG